MRTVVLSTSGTNPHAPVAVVITAISNLLRCIYTTSIPFVQMYFALFCRVPRICSYVVAI